ncbi:MAG: transcription termination/antitermination protein NusG, partial [Acidaminococcaceae bacterium]
NKVTANLERKIRSLGMEEEIFNVLVPMENEIEIKDGKKKITPKKVFPGYVLVEMIVNDRSWYAVRNTPGVTGFVGSGSKPIPLTDSEVVRILGSMGVEDGKPKINFTLQQLVRLTAGPFVGCVGKVAEINAERGKLKVLVDMFGRETPVEIDFTQVEETE